MVSKHDRLTDILADLTRDDVEFKWMNTEYGFDTHVVGEIDLMMLRQGVLWVFEVKTSHSPFLARKADYQLRKARTHIPEILQEEGYTVDSMYTFYVHGFKGKRNMDIDMKLISSYKGL
jgi:hypothetical protein